MERIAFILSLVFFLILLSYAVVAGVDETESARGGSYRGVLIETVERN